MAPLEEAWITQVRQIAEPVVKDNFLELFDFGIRRQGSKLVLTLVLDRKDSPVTLDDCTTVSRDVEKRLDELDLIPSAYLLEVSSAGLDRPLRGLEDCERFKGRKALFVMNEPLEGQVSFEGRLGDTRDGQVELAVTPEKRVWIAFGKVKKARLVVEI